MGVFKLRSMNFGMLKTKEDAVDPKEAFREADVGKVRQEVVIEEECPSQETGEMPSEKSGEEELQRDSAPAHTKSVSFTHLDFRMYNVTIGDHPYCQTGCPLTLDWEYTEAGALPIDQYEAERSPRRTRTELRKTCEERHQILSQDGHSDDELRRAQRKLHRSRSCSTKLCNKMNNSFFHKNLRDTTLHP